MTPRRPLLPMLASLAAHGGAAALLALASSESLPSALFIVLSELEPAAIASGPRQARAGTGPPTTAAAPQTASPSRPSAPAAGPSPLPPTQDAAPAPPTPAAPGVERQTPPAPVRELERAAAASAIREESLTGAARGSASPSVVEGGAGSGAVSDGGAGRAAAEHSPALPGAGAGGAGTSVAVAPSGSRGGEPGAEYGPYLSGMRRRIQQALQYPPAARRRGLKGTVLLEILIRPDGAISEVSVTTSSSHRLLDDAAIDAVRSLPPQPFPADLLRRPLTVQLPVVFDLQ